MLRRYLYAGLDRDLEPDPAAVRRARVLGVCGLVSSVASTTFGVQHILAGFVWSGIVFVLAGAVFFASPLLLRATRRVGLVAHLVAGGMALCIGCSMYTGVGIGSPAGLAFGIVPAVAALVGGRRFGVIWLVVSFVVLLSFLLASVFGLVFIDTMGAADRHFAMQLLPFVMLAAFASISLAHASLEDDVLRRALRAERQRALADKADAMASTERLALIGQMAAGVAHEINNPLTYVLGNLELLEESVAGPWSDEAAAEVRDALTDTREGARRIQAIVRRLSTHARSDEEPRAVRLAEVIDAALMLAKHELSSRAEVVPIIEGDPIVYADEGQLVQVFLNLLFNAAQAIPADREGNRIDICVVETMSTGEVTVRDNGTGIPEGILSRVTEPFFSTKPVGQGSGLGLSICTSILRSYGGSLQIDSSSGFGTQVRVSLPLHASSAVRSGVAAGGEDKPCRVLVVDDEERVLQVVRKLLPDLDVRIARSGAEAMSHLENGGGDVDVVLCDAMMPEQTGFEVYRELCQRQPRLARRFVLMTGGAPNEQLDAFLREADVPLLRKPVNRQSLRATVWRTAGSTGD